MLGRIAAGFLAALFAMTGCATPSVNPIWSAERGISEPGIAGTWRPAREEDRTTYAITERGDAYRMLVRSDDPEHPKEWEFEIRLVKLGEARFADVAAAPDERGRVGERWGPFFVPTHMIVKYALEGDSLRVWLLRREWLEASALPWTSHSKDVSLITAPTPDLQKFLEESAAKPRAFWEPIGLRRSRP
jgi:hypothetical protein